MDIHNSKENAKSNTQLLQMVAVPILEHLEPNPNQIGYWMILPFTFYTIIVGVVIVCGTWTWKNRESSVIKSSQPIFLWFILLGTLILGSTLIPISIDDGVSEKFSNVACQSIFWFPAIGVTMIFAALFSKAWRLGKILHSSLQYRRVIVTARDVIVPFVILLVANVVVLLTWHFHDPLEFQREPHEGTDLWNRIRHTQGQCQSNHKEIYGCILFALSLLAMILASIATWRVRKFETDFDESSYIGVVVIVYGK